MPKWKKKRARPKEDEDNDEPEILEDEEYEEQDDEPVIVKPKKKPATASKMAPEPEYENRYEKKTYATQTTDTIVDKATGDELTMEEAIIRILNDLDELKEYVSG